MSDTEEPRLSSAGGSRTAKEKNEVRKAVTALLDELAPERVVRLVDQLRGPVEQHRPPNGCVLQAPNAAVTVSWFAPSDSDPTLGELRIIVWRGQVARRGTIRSGENATTVAELTLHPVDHAGRIAWRASDGTDYDTTALVAHCLAMLQEQIADR